MEFAYIGLVVITVALVQFPLGNLLAHTAVGAQHMRAEKLVYKTVGVNPNTSQSAKAYGVSLVAFTGVSIAVLFALLMFNNALPGAGATTGMSWQGALNTAISFVTNTNWQWYVPETTLGYASQALGLTVQNFLSAAVGIAVAFALARAFAARSSQGIGNFWVDVTRVTVRILLPLAMLAAVALIAGGVIDNLVGATSVQTISGGTLTIPGGPVATQEAIKQLGTNGGGFFNANAAHPFENPTMATNLLSIVLMLAIPFSLPRAFGIIIGSKRQGYAVLAAMTALWSASVALLVWAELAANGKAADAAGAALEGKELRFGAVTSALYAASTTATSTGSVNASHDSLTAPGSLVALVNMLLGEISPGGVGSGLYGMLMVAMVAVFLAGLMVGRTPELYGKKLNAKAMSLVAIYIVTTPTLMLVGSAITLGVDALRAEAVTQEGAHGITTVLYAYASAANNNGSAMASFNSAGSTQLLMMAAVMLLGRIVPMLVVLGLARTLAVQTKVEPSAGTLRSDTPLFTTLVVGVAPIVALVAYAPALALGPLAEALS